MIAKVSVFKEPRGIMRIVQLILAIIAFATICNFSAAIKLDACKGATEYPVNFQISYPFSLSSMPPAVAICPQPGGSVPAMPKIEVKVYLAGDFSSDAQFFVATGVLSFLYCLLAIVVYALFDEKYQSSSWMPLADLCTTFLFAVLWVSSSGAWANSVTGIRHVTDPSYIISDNSAAQITHGHTDSLITLSIVAAFGFLNCFAWASDLWFLYKETHWFKLSQGSAGGV